MTTRLVDGWFVDRATGRGKPVYLSGTTIVPTNGVVGGGVTGALTAGSFANGATVSTIKDLLDGWFCDRAPGEGKIVYGDTLSTIVSTNGPAGGGTGYTNPPAGVGGKFYFEITVGYISAGQVTGAQIGFINPTQRDDGSSSQIIQLAFPGLAGGRVIAQGRNVNGAVVDYSNNPAGWICGTQIINPAVAPGRWNTGDVIGVAVDTINNRFWSRNWVVTAGSVMGQLGTWEGGGNPVTPTAGWDISALTGDLIIWFGAPGRYLDSATLNTGATTFYGLDGTGVIPPGYVAWDATGATKWDPSAASNTSLIGLISTINAYIKVFVSGLTAFVYTQPLNLPSAILLPYYELGGGWANLETDIPILTGNMYLSTWSNATAYNINEITMDSWSAFGYQNAFFRKEFTGAASVNQPVINPGTWESVVMGVVSNTSKARV